MCSGIEQSGLVKDVDLVHLHQNGDPPELVNAVKHGGIVLDHISDRLGIVQTGLLVRRTDLCELGSVLFQNLLDLLERRDGIFVCLAVCVGNLEGNDDDRQNGDQDQCDQIHVPADNFFEWLHPCLLCGMNKYKTKC